MEQFPIKPLSRKLVLQFIYICIYKDVYSRFSLVMLFLSIYKVPEKFVLNLIDSIVKFVQIKTQC